MVHGEAAGKVAKVNLTLREEVTMLIFFSDRGVVVSRTLSFPRRSLGSGRFVEKRVRSSVQSAVESTPAWRPNSCTRLSAIGMSLNPTIYNPSTWIKGG
jgi:hypothetical protein